MSFLFLYFAVLFEKLVEQHDVHRILAHGLDLRLCHCESRGQEPPFSASSAMSPNLIAPLVEQGGTKGLQQRGVKLQSSVVYSVIHWPVAKLKNHLGL